MVLMQTQTLFSNTFKNHLYPTISARMKKMRLNESELRDLAFFVLARNQSNSKVLIDFQSELNTIDTRRKRGQHNGH